MELNYPHCPSICPPLERRWTHWQGCRLGIPLISLILGVLRCDKIFIHTDSLEGIEWQ
jgi:hypothetical protein